ncbi:CUB and sushi domain-containing protein 3-like [Mya arenaria]|uniref:CUB and sushi domain-containing protein 3-like n=1 Tax=Mya arenaria TaxID=6604 RepID=UPI0022E16BB8|nr:CUB and sushi domain-containing protein 3-like [Mya arenaria]
MPVCDTPATPADGSVVVSTDGGTVRYSCDSGTTLAGNVEQQCQTNGQGWAGTPPICVSCTTLTQPDNGNMTTSTDGSASTVTYTCDVGYTLAGDGTRQCSVTGVWTGSDPICQMCTALVTPNSGSVHFISNGTSTVASFMCVPDYMLSGSSESQCTSTGVWTQVSPTCVCESPAAPDQGAVSLSADNMTATFRCDVGYVISGSDVRECSSVGLGWDGTQPTCEPCEALSQIENGSVSLDTEGSTTRAVHSCMLGATLTGESVLHCLQNGSWSSLQPNCVLCPTLSAPDSGLVSMFTDGMTSTANFSCGSDYFLVGNDVISCAEDGSWSAAEPVCQCNDPVGILHGSVTSDGQTAVYTCDLGYTLDDEPQRACSTEGLGWEGDAPSCVSCPQLIAPTDGSLVLITNGTSTVATFTCNIGGILLGSASITCSSDGVWSGDLPTCVVCGTLTDPDSGEVALSTDGLVTVATYSCVTGYHVNGEVSITCETSGQWGNVPPTCVCDAPLTPDSGSVEISADGRTALYTCDAGYTLVGVSARSCRTLGAGWNETDPSCKVCNVLSSPGGGQVTLVTDGTDTRAEITCDTGYTMSGESTLVCRSDGTWHLSVPTCTACESMTTPANGNLQFLTDGTETQANYTCTVGYSISGPALLSCRSDGSWDLTPPSCVQCAVLDAPAAGHIATFTDGVATIASFSCVSGYHLDGADSRTCSAAGNWDLESPRCVCDVPTNLNNGNVDVSSDGMTATFSCDVGLSLSGAQSSVCDTLGSGWDAAWPTCVACPELESVSNGTSQVTSDGAVTSWSVSCDVGSTVSGAISLECQPDGTWTGQLPECGISASCFL